MAASQRQRASPAVSTRNPSHPGSSQNQSAKKAAPTVTAAIVLSQGESGSDCGEVLAFGIGPPFVLAAISPANKQRTLAVMTGQAEDAQITELRAVFVDARIEADSTA
jgi:hypothetical protein